MTTTIVDGPKTIKLTVDADGKQLELVDNSEVIKYTYYANNQLKEAIYGSHVITKKYDQLGNMISEHDPSVSNQPTTYKYYIYG